MADGAKPQKERGFAMAENEKKEAFKLYVVGEDSSNPEDWWRSYRTLVLARNPEEAMWLAGRCNDTAVEVIVTEPTVLSVIDDNIDERMDGS